MSAGEKSTTLEVDSVLFHERENYPLNLSGYDAAEVDLEVYHVRLHGDISRLVGDSTNIRALTVKYSNGSHG